MFICPHRAERSLRAYAAVSSSYGVGLLSPEGATVGVAKSPDALDRGGLRTFGARTTLLRGRPTAHLRCSNPDPEHVPRNPALSNLPYDTGFIERYGYGIRLIRREVEEHPFCSVAFSTAPNRFSVTFRREVGSLVDETDRRILGAVRELRKSGEIAGEVGVSKTTVVRRLKTLEGLGLVRKQEAGAHVRYVAVR